MAIRTNIPDVKSIMNEDMPLTDTDINKYIKTASLLLDKVYESDTSMSDDLLEEIEKWMAAHLIAISRYRIAAKEEVGDAAITYQEKLGEGLKATMYGQTALVMDTSGLLAKLEKRLASMYAIISFDE